jgi:hypothetical protein
MCYLTSSCSVSRHHVGIMYVRFEVFTAVTEKFRLLGYKNPVCTLQETHYVSTTESSQLMLCKI